MRLVLATVISFVLIIAVVVHLRREGFIHPDTTPSDPAHDRVYVDNAYFHARRPGVYRNL